MAWEENSCISLNMQLIAILSRIGVSSSICSEIEIACLVYNLNVPIKAKDPPWFAVQMGSVADSVAVKI